MTLAATIALHREPRRIQRQRTKGWRMPDGAVYVGRPSPWGNPYRSGDRADMAAVFREGISWMSRAEIDDWVGPLRGHDLVCWCPLDQPCHADVLLELATRSHSL